MLPCHERERLFDRCFGHGQHMRLKRSLGFGFGSRSRRENKTSPLFDDRELSVGREQVLLHERRIAPELLAGTALLGFIKLSHAIRADDLAQCR